MPEPSKTNVLIALGQDAEGVKHPVAVLEKVLQNYKLGWPELASPNAKGFEGFLPEGLTRSTL